MENQKKYEQTVYNICQLVINRKYKRAIYIADHIISQGFSSHELLALKSYAISKSQGPRQALESIQYQQGPLISMAKAQYCQSLHFWQDAQTNLSNLVTSSQSAPMDGLLDSNKALMTGYLSEANTFNSDKVLYVSQHKQTQFIAKLNQITSLYNILRAKKQNNQLKDDKQFNQECQALAKNYEQLLRQYRPKKSIFTGIQQYIQYLREIKSPQS